MRILHFASLVAALAACEDDRPIQWDRDRAVLGPVPLKTQVAYVDSALDRVTLVDVAASTPAISTRRIGRNAIVAVPSSDRHTLFVITRGEEAVKRGQVDQPPLLWVVDTTDPNAKPISYAVGSPFDRLALSPDHSIAVAYFSAAGPDTAGFFRNPNELAIIDLTRPPGDDNPTVKTIRSFGSVPAGVVLSPPMAIAGDADASPRTFAFVLADNNLTVLDASHPARREISIRLDLGTQTVTPREIVFAPATASAYVRSDHARDVLQVILQPLPPAQPGDNDYLPELAELGAGGGPTDIAVYDDASQHRRVLASTPDTGDVVVIDADTAQFRTVAIPAPIDRILLFSTGDPSSPPHEALFASLAANSPQLFVLDLDDIADPLVQPAARLIQLDQPVLDVVPVPDRDLALVVHDDARTVIGLLDMTTESTSPLLGVGKLDSYDFSPSGTHLIGATYGVPRIGFVELDDLHPTDFRLDDPPARVVSLEDGKIFVDHGDPFGRATIIPSPDATRDQAIVLTGFLTANLLDQEP
jgi:hypothetical protein